MRLILSFCLLSMIASGCSVVKKNDDYLADAPVRIERVTKLEDQKALKAISEQWRMSYMAGNISSLISLYEEDAWLMTNGQPLQRGVNNIRSYFKARIRKAKKLDIIFDYEDVNIDGNFGFVTAKWWLEVEVDGQAAPIRDLGRSMLVFKRDLDGNWRIWRDIDNKAADVTWEMRP